MENSWKFTCSFHHGTLQVTFSNHENIRLGVKLSWMHFPHESLQHRGICKAHPQVNFLWFWNRSEPCESFLFLHGQHWPHPPSTDICQEPWNGFCTMLGKGSRSNIFKLLVAQCQLLFDWATTNAPHLGKQRRKAAIAKAVGRTVDDTLLGGKSHLIHLACHLVACWWFSLQKMDVKSEPTKIHNLYLYIYLYICIYCEQFDPCSRISFSWSSLRADSRSSQSMQRRSAFFWSRSGSWANNGVPSVYHVYVTHVVSLCSLWHI